MYLLILGLLMWVGVHMFPSVATEVRTHIVNKIGLGPYKGLFALLIVSSVVIIVLGWRSVTPTIVYDPPNWGRVVTLVLTLFTFILFVAAKRKTNIKRILRHPQLTGLVLWSIGHLLANGDNRSLILFSCLGIWALLEIIMINRREGAWVKPEAVPVKSDVITVIGGCVLYSLLLIIHPYLSGVKLV